MKRLPAAWIVAHLIWNGRVQSIWIADAALHAKTLNIKTQVYCSVDDLRPCWEKQLHHWIEQHLKKIIIKNHGFLLISGLGMIKRTPPPISNLHLLIPPPPSTFYPCWLRGCNAWRFIFVSTRVRRLRWAYQPCVYLTSTSQNPPLLQDAKPSLESLHTSFPLFPHFSVLLHSSPLHSTLCLRTAFPIIRVFSPLQAIH